MFTSIYKNCLKIGGDDLESIAVLAAQAHPLVICGVLGGRGDEVYGVFPVTNTSADPAVFSMHPEELENVSRSIANSGWSLIGMYYSEVGELVFPSTDCYYSRIWHEISPRYLVISMVENRRAPTLFVCDFTRKDNLTERLELGVYNICGKCSARYYGCGPDCPNCGRLRVTSGPGGILPACPNCGKVQPEGTRHCTNCGLPQNPFFNLGDSNDQPCRSQFCRGAVRRHILVRFSNYHPSQAEETFAKPLGWECFVCGKRTSVFEQA